MKNIKRGDFSNLAKDYAKYRPSYNKKVVNLILSSVNKNFKSLKAVDIGAGTGLFTKCLLNAGLNKVSAIEPNDDMRKAGMKFLGNKVDFLTGSAEQTNLNSKIFDLVTMASSFHWADTSKALKEFDRILSPKGVFCALWNPRLTEKSTSESEIQKLLLKKYNLGSRVSSGLSGITLKLREILTQSGIFKSVVYIDAVDVVQRSHAEYIGAWRSVNDVQAQLGPYKFEEFIKDVKKIISKSTYVDVHYLTRAWIASK